MRRLRIDRPQAATKHFSIAISKTAHKRLREASKKFGVSHNHILSALLEKVDFNLVRPEIEQLIADATRGRVSQPSAEEVRQYLAGLTPEQRAALLKEDTDE